MRNHLFVFLVALIFSVSLNLSQCQHGQQLQTTREGEKLKSNDRRSSGLFNYPRVGRSDLPVSNPNLNRRHDIEPDTDFQLYGSDLDSVLDKDYEAAGFPERSMNPKHTEKIPKEMSWLIADRPRSTNDYRPWQRIDDSRPLYPNPLQLFRGSRTSQVNGYTPRLGRENDLDRPFCK
ncbi:unnamed protein product [Xylocopa violacea]|uniref:Uncharacterized protein n=1 Tax=Xylocopa violacea TaxID=135666 RepID=A0ABP1NHN2_XYLVO